MRLYQTILVLPLLLAACAEPSTYSPTYSAEELAAERAAQEAYAKEAASATGSVTGPTAPVDRDAMIARLSRIGGKVQQAGTEICKQIYGEQQQCTYAIALDKNDAPLNAYADGKRVVVSPAMMQFAADDDELALVLAHEYAHNLEKHPQKTTQNATTGSLAGLAADMLASSQGFNTGGAFQQVGGQYSVLKYSQAFETEADYVGLYVMERAGYDIDEAPKFWRRMSARDPRGIAYSGSHPSNPARYLVLAKTAEEIASKEARNVALVPERQPPSS